MADSVSPPLSRCRRRLAPSAISITPRWISGRPGMIPGFTWRARWAAGAAPLRTEPLSSNCRASEVPRIPCSGPAAFAAPWVPRPFGPFLFSVLAPLFCGVFSAGSLFLPGPLPFSAAFSAPSLGPPSGFPCSGFRGSSVLRCRRRPSRSGRGPGAPSGSPRSRRDSSAELSSHSASSDPLSGSSRASGRGPGAPSGSPRSRRDAEPLRTESSR